MVEEQGNLGSVGVRSSVWYMFLVRLEAHSRRARQISLERKVYELWVVVFDVSSSDVFSSQGKHHDSQNFAVHSFIDGYNFYSDLYLILLR